MSVGMQTARGEQRRLFLRSKQAYSTTFPAFAAGNTMRCKDFKIGWKRKLEKRVDNRQTLGNHARIPGMIEGNWSIEASLQASGVLGTPWPMSPFLAAALGSETINVGVDVRYSPNDAQNALGWLDLMREMNEVVSETGMNGWLNELKINCKGGGEAMVTASGGCSDTLVAGSGTLNGDHLNGDNALILDPDQVDSIQVGAVLIIGTSNPGNTGHTVTNVNPGADTITVAPALVGAQADGSVVRPWVPSEATAPDVIPGILGTCEIDVISFDITEVEISFLMGIEPHDDEAFKEVVEDYSRSWRDITGFVKFRAYRDQIAYLNQRKTPGARYPLNFTMGSIAGRIAEFDLPQIEWDFDDLEVPNEGSAMITAPWTAMTSADNVSDEIEVILR